MSVFSVAAIILAIPVALLLAQLGPMITGLIVLGFTVFGASILVSLFGHSRCFRFGVVPCLVLGDRGRKAALKEDNRFRLCQRRET
jgi:hypothetical protein